MSERSAIERILEASALKAALLKGAAVAVVRGEDSDVFTLGEGVEASTLVEVGSLTKVFTALLLAQSVLRGEMTLQSRVDEVLFGEHWGEPAAIDAELLATHHSGLPRVPKSPLLRGFLGDPYRDADRKGLLKYLRSERPRRPAAPHFEYSNMGYAVLGLMLEQATGCTYDELLHERLLQPMGLQETHLQLTGGREWPVQGHRAKGEPAKPWHFQAYAPCGGMVSTLNDLVMAMRMMMNPTHAIAEAMEFSVQPRAEIPLGTIGLAWIAPKGGEYVWHNGATYGHVAFLGISRRAKLGVAVVANHFLPTEITQLGHLLMRDLITAA